MKKCNKSIFLPLSDGCCFFTLINRVQKTPKTGCCGISLNLLCGKSERGKWKNLRPHFTGNNFRCISLASTENFQGTRALKKKNRL